MTLLRDLRRFGVRVLAPVAVATAMLVACGGGTSQVTAFVPDRLLVVGDETHLIVNDGNNDGFKYGINDRRGTAAGKCQLLPNVAQQLANLYGFVFEQCNPTAAAPKAFLHAIAQAKVDDATTGLEKQLAGIGALGPQDLVLVTVGANDVIDLYERVKSGLITTAAAASTEARRRGGVAAAQVNTILGQGARALVITVPNLGLSPYATAAKATDTTAVTLLTQLAADYNAALRTQIDSASYDGRNYGLILADDIVAAMHRFPSSYLASPYDVAVAACTSAQPTDCVLTDDATTTTLVSGASATSHLWASDRHLAPSAISQIAQQTLSRAVNNPF